MNHWTRPDRVIAYIRLVRRPVTLAECADALRDDFSSISATLSALYRRGELNRMIQLDGYGRRRYHYTDPDYDELDRLRGTP